MVDRPSDRLVESRTLPGAVRRGHVAMLLENNPYPQDVRVRREAESLVAAGYPVRVIAPRAAGQPRRETVAGVRVRRFRVPQGAGHGAGTFVIEYLVAALALHLAAVRELVGGARVVHLHNPPDVLFLAGALARLLGRRVVFDHHDLGPELVAEKLGPGVWVGLARAAERATFAVADITLAANASHAEVARRRGGVRAGAIRIVRNGPPASALVAPGQAQARPGRLADPRLVYVGAVSAQDGVEDLAEVLALLVGRHGLAGAHLEIVGDGDALPAVEAALARSGVRDHATLAGWVAHAEVPYRIRRADLCVDPAAPSALNSRSTMIKIAEYMAAGKPVVARDLLETRRTLGEAGVLVAEPGAPHLAVACAALAGDPRRRADLGARALERARGLTWEHGERELLGAYRALWR